MSSREMCLVLLIHLIHGGFQAFGLLRQSVTQRSAFIVYSNNPLIVLVFICLFCVCFIVDIKISEFWMLLFYSQS